MKKADIYRWVGACVMLAAIIFAVKGTGGRERKQTEVSTGPQMSKKDKFVHPTPLVADSRDGFVSSRSRASIDRSSTQGRIDGPEVPAANLPNDAAFAAADLERDISRLSDLRIEGAEKLSGLLERALSTPESSTDDIEFMTAYHRARASAPASTQEY